MGLLLQPWAQVTWRVRSGSPRSSCAPATRTKDVVALDEDDFASGTRDDVLPGLDSPFSALEDSEDDEADYLYLGPLSVCGDGVMVDVTDVGSDAVIPFSDELGPFGPGVVAAAEASTPFFGETSAMPVPEADFFDSFRYGPFLASPEG